ncbi:hypothetical protein [Nocardia asiatica]|uniref:hypothetical protein n=1 Tax=Nocardia asiatica TaxID=209252 RepID=UPI0024548BB2|nr:hypothetical protein [Nocardia asiatica]
MTTEEAVAEAISSSIGEVSVVVVTLPIRTPFRSELATWKALYNRSDTSSRGLFALRLQPAGRGWSVFRTCLRMDKNRLARNGRPVTVKADERLFRYNNGDPISEMRLDIMWRRIGEQLPWVTQQGISCHCLRHTTLRWVERNFGHAVVKAYAGPADNHNNGATSICTRATREEVAYDLSVLTGEPHPLPPNLLPLSTEDFPR